MKKLLLFVLLLPGLVNAQLTFENQPHTGHGITPVLGGMIHADVNNDGNEDVFAFGWTHLLNETWGVTLYLGNGNGGFTPSSTQPFSAHQRVNNAKFVYYDSDNHIDLVVSYLDTTTNKSFVSVLINDGTGNLVPTHTFEVENITEIYFLDVADLSNNGELDIFVSVRFSSNNYGAFIYGNNNNVFTKFSSIGIDGFYDGCGVIFDYDQDGKKDILISGWNGTVLITKLYRNLGAMNFQEVSTPFPPLNNSIIAVGNIDNNTGGFESVALAGSIDGVTEILHIYLNNNGVFTLHQTFPGTQIGQIVFADFNNNGALDFAVVAGLLTTSTGRVFENVESNFVLRRTFNPGLAGAAVVAFDFNNDDRSDIIYSGSNNAFGVEIYAYKNTTQTMSVDDFTKDSVIMYPNPTRGPLSIQLPNSVEVTGIFVTDITGRVITLPAGNLVDISNLSSGMYLVTVQSNDLQVTKKIVKK